MRASHHRLYPYCCCHSELQKQLELSSQLIDLNAEEVELTTKLHTRLHGKATVVLGDRQVRASSPEPPPRMHDWNLTYAMHANS